MEGTLARVRILFAARHVESLPDSIQRVAIFQAQFLCRLRHAPVRSGQRRNNGRPINLRVTVRT